MLILINMGAAGAVFAAVLGMTYPLSLLLVAAGALPLSPFGDSKRARRRARASQIAGVQFVYGIGAALAGFLLTVLAIPVVLFTPLVGVYIFFFALPLETLSEYMGFSREVSNTLAIAIPSLPFHAFTQFTAYVFAIRQVKSLAVSR